MLRLERRFFALEKRLLAYKSQKQDFLFSYIVGYFYLKVRHDEKRAREEFQEA